MTSTTPQTMPIAVIGMGCRFPGDASSPDKLWEACAAARNTWSEWPESRLNIDGFFHPRMDNLGTIHSRGCHFLNEDVSLCDTSFFSFTTDVAKAMDPQMRILLETAYEAFESAGLSLRDVSGTSTSVFAGAMFHDYQDMLVQDTDNLPRYFMTGNASAMVANRISHFYNLVGPSVTVDTACSTSMAAVHLACQSLRAGDSTMAVIGGANLMLYPAASIALSTLGFTSSEGKSYSFDSRAGGYGRGEGVGCVVLKPLKAALRDGDPIRAVIRETAMNQDGFTPTITSPSQQAQETIMRACYRRAGLNPLDTAYVECHGTGTMTGDVVEANAIGTVFGTGRPRDDPLFIGSIKANFGHTETTSGIAAIIKVVCMLERGLIPPQALYERPNPKIDFAKLNIKVPLEMMPWPQNKIRRISISNFGAGGTNIHAIVEDSRYHLPSISQSRCMQMQHIASHGKPLLFTLSAKGEASVQAATERLHAYLETASMPQDRLRNLAYTLAQRRSHLPWRVAVSAHSRDQLRVSLADPSLRPVRASYSKPPRLGFVFTGQGAQWHAMGRELITTYPVFYGVLEAANSHLKSLGASWNVFGTRNLANVNDMVDELYKSKASSELDKPHLSFPVTVILQLALVQLLRSWGIVPQAVTGHSSGEISAAYCAGLLTFEDAITIAYLRGKLTMSYVTAGRLDGAMTALGVGKDEAEDYVAHVSCGTAVIACVNSPHNVTVSGDVAALKEIEALAASQQVFCRRLKVPAAYHSPHMEVLASEYLTQLDDRLSTPSPQTPRVPFASPVTGGLVEDDGALRKPSHWVQNMVGCVQFEDALRSIILDGEGEREESAAVDSIIEIGPHAALKGAIRQTLAHHSLSKFALSVDSCLQREEDAVLSMQTLAGRLHCQGYTVNLDAVNFPLGGDQLRVLTDLPRYQWAYSGALWAEPACVGEALRQRRARHDMLGVKVPGLNDGQHIWRNSIRVSHLPWTRDHLIQSECLYPGAGFVIMVVDAMRELAAAGDDTAKGYTLSQIDLYNGLVVPQNDQGVELQLSLRDQSSQMLQRRSRKDFSFYSRAKNGSWTGHCRGKAEVTHGRPSITESIPEASQLTPMDVASFYRQMATFGPTFGPGFQNITSLARGSKVALATVTIPDYLSMMPAPHHSEYRVHPATLDACFQVAFATVPDAIISQFGLCVPNFADSLFIEPLAHSSPGSVLHVVATLQSVDHWGFKASVTVYDNDGAQRKIVMKTDGIKVHSLSGRRIADPMDGSTVLKPRWQPDLGLLSPTDLGKLLEAGDASTLEASLFPEDSRSMAANETEGAPGATLCGKHLSWMRAYMSLFSHKQPRARILEIGAAAGTLTAAVLQGLSRVDTEVLRTLIYDYTDCDAKYFADARQRFDKFSGQMRYQTLDLERDLEGQGFDQGTYDLVIAKNVLHDNERLEQIIPSIRRLLKPGGRLLTLEKTACCSAEGNAIWTDNGFSNLNSLVQETGAAAGRDAISLMEATALAKGMQPSPSFPKHICLIPLQSPQPDTEVAKLGQALHDLTGTKVSISPLGGSSVRGKTCIILAEAESDLLASMEHDRFDALKRTMLEAEHVLWVSQGATIDSSAPEAAMHIGLLRTLRLEEQGKRYISLDLDPNEAYWQAASFQTICAVFRQALDAKKTEQREYEYSCRSGLVHTTRYHAEKSINEELQGLAGNLIAKPTSFSYDGPYTKLEVASPGLLDSLVFRQYEDEDASGLAPWTEDMVEIRPRAFGLNFRDVLVAAGELQEKCMGYECAGYVSRVGSDVPGDLFVGARVCALMQSGHWANRVRAKWTSVAPIPSDMSFDTAASIPMSFVTAYHALVDLARLEHGESVLIHSAAGGFGQAAVTMAQHLGADIYATVGSEAKRRFLTETYGIPDHRIFTSRDDSFHAEIVRATGGRGVDVVLNSLAGPLLQATWECVADSGRFIELGKRDAQHGMALPMNNFSRAVSFISMDTVILGKTKGEKLHRTFREVMNLFETRRIAHQMPISLFSQGTIGKAFRYLQRGKHIGKIVVQVEEGEPVDTIVPPRPVKFDAAASYLIVGGLGGVGLVIARWMASSGAKHLILLSRSAEQQDTTQLRADFEASGVDLILRSCDITDRKDLERVIGECRETRPIRGVIQAATVLQDAIFSNMTAKQWQTCVNPKVHGTANLDRLFQSHDLDFFVVLSSSTATLGNMGQANYTAAGTYQDALALRRVAKGIPGVSIALGPILSVGVAARAGLEGRLDKSGYFNHDIPELLRLIDTAIRHPRMGQMVIGIKPWSQPGGLDWRREPRFSCLWVPCQGGEAKDGSSASPISVRDRIERGVEPAHAILVKVLRARLAKVLGISTTAVEPKLPLVSYGIDSLVAVELRNWLMMNVAEVSIFEITQSGSLNELARRLEEKMS